MAQRGHKNHEGRCPRKDSEIVRRGEKSCEYAADRSKWHFINIWIEEVIVETDAVFARWEPLITAACVDVLESDKKFRS